ncbi:MAG: hypothetical protein JHC26_01660 [Thermofilum sp.]|uniref:hypothetical protein n=1 Tax=Thermofilum sp. TaxID=1961369 RepID=UPI0025903504|nr:hypothetical protein [Thermofilum sp.]MCI4407768.1 hypothetical protein [Thermofilum sp.]
MGDDERDPFLRLQYEEWKKHNTPSILVARDAGPLLILAFAGLAFSIFCLVLAYVLAVMH